MLFDPATIARLLYSAIVVIAVYFSTLGLHRLIAGRVADPGTRFALSRLVTYLAVGLAITVLGIIWLPRLGGFSVAIGLIAAGIAFSAQQLTTSIVGWLLITTGQAFDVGDRIEMGGIRGDVIGFGVLRTTLMEIGGWIQGDQYTGRIVTVSNAAAFQQPIYNYTRYFPYIWDEIDLPLELESNWPNAMAVCLDVATAKTHHLIADAKDELEAMAEEFYVGTAELKPQVYLNVTASQLTISVRYVVPVRQRRSIHSAISEGILSALRGQSGISIGTSPTVLSGSLEVSLDSPDQPKAEDA